MTLKIGSLFSGYMGLDLAVESVLDAETAWFVEYDKAPSKILAHHRPNVPNYGDVTTVDWSAAEPVDVITGGSPCQDLSHAGRRAGMTEGTRSNLWVAMREAIAALRPSLVVWENVRGAYSAEADSELEQCPRCVGDPRDRGPVLRALGRVLGDLSELGYDCRWHGLRAADVGAPHGRFRVFVVATDARSLRRGAGWPTVAREATRGRTSADVAGRGNTPACCDPHGVTFCVGCGDDVKRGRRLPMLPTPTTRDFKGHNQRRDETCLTGALLPTPAAQEPGGTAAQYHARLAAHDGRESTFLPLSMAVQLLPTPSVADTTGGRKHRSGDRSGELLLNGIAAAEQWGQYADAIARWESLTRPAPQPTQPSKKDTPQLSPAFSEWLMGLPEGHVTGVPGLSRNDMLKALGNGVVPQQAEAALRFLLSVQAVAA